MSCTLHAQADVVLDCKFDRGCDLLTIGSSDNIMWKLFQVASLLSAAKELSSIELSRQASIALPIRPIDTDRAYSMEGRVIPFLETGEI